MTTTNQQKNDSNCQVIKQTDTKKPTGVAAMLKNWKENSNHIRNGREKVKLGLTTSIAANATDQEEASISKKEMKNIINYAKNALSAKTTTKPKNHGTINHVLYAMKYAKDHITYMEAYSQATIHANTHT